MSPRPMTGRRMVVVGASAGIGRSVATHAVALGAEVVFCGRRVARLDEAIAAAGGGTAFAADVTDPQQCADLVDAAVARLGQVDVLVYAAGASRLHRIEHTTAADWDRVLQTNVIAPALISGRLLAHSPDRSIMAFLSSVVVGRPYEGLVPYAASKAALEEMVRGLRTEHPEHRFMIVNLGGTAGTEFTRDYDPKLARALFPRWTAAGVLPSNSMVLDHVGGLIADNLAALLAAPDLDCHDIVLRPSGPSLTARPS
ncbi:MAG: SDR family oxidoreductase [Acidimicrobiia bacterium]